MSRGDFTLECYECGEEWGSDEPDFDQDGDVDEDCIYCGSMSVGLEDWPDDE